MKITIRNLGIIKEAKIDLKPLTIFVGPNNTGKTWTAYAIANVFSSYSFSRYIDAYVRGDIPNIYQSLDDAVKQVTKSGVAAIDLVQFVNDYGETYFNDIAHFTQQLMPGFLGTDLASFETLDIAIDFNDIKAHVLEYILNASLRRDIGGSQIGKPLVTIRKARKDKEAFIYISQDLPATDSSITEGQAELEIPSAIIKDLLVEGVLILLHRAIYPNVRILPTERTTFIAHPLQKNRRIPGEETTPNQTAQARKIKAAPITFSYFFNMLERASLNETRERIQGEKNARSERQIKEYIKLAEVLEGRILGGTVKFSQTEAPYPDREILFQPTNDSALEISVASSMVKELSSLLFYLRYLAVPEDLIVIDEPEMNLHPEAQVKIIELLAALANAHLNILITTHSPYIVDHLTNLMKANEVENKDEVCETFYLKRTDAFISKNKVSVYLFNQGQVMKAIDEDGLIELNTFGQVSDQISEIYFNL